MCRRSDVRESQKAQDSAAEALARACASLCTDGIGMALQKLYNDTVEEEVPQDILDLVGKLR